MSSESVQRFGRETAHAFRYADVVQRLRDLSIYMVEGAQTPKGFGDHIRSERAY